MARLREAGGGHPCDWGEAGLQLVWSWRQSVAGMGRGGCHLAPCAVTRGGRRDAAGPGELSLWGLR